MPKKDYRVRNWPHYNKSLVKRGSITCWFSKNLVSSWQGSRKKPEGRGRPEKYPDQLIQAALIFRQLYNLPLRSTEGFLRSLMELLQLPYEVPTYSTLSKRGKTLHIGLRAKEQSKPRHVLIDSTGIQVIGEGEWKTLKHGKTSCQVWRKLHLAIDADDQTILAATMTKSVSLDGNYLPGLINRIEGVISQVTGDGAYDKKNCYESAHGRNAKPVFPPQHNASVQRNKKKKNPALDIRDNVINSIGRGLDREERLKKWKEENNYYCRSLIETMMFRMKSIFGDRMRSRSYDNQETDLFIRCYIINKLNRLGLPKSEAIE